MKLRRILSFVLTALLLCSAFPAQAAQNDYYIIPDSDTRYLTEDELWDWQYEALGYIYNEIFARHGRSFRSGQKYDVYFRSQAWYSVNPSYRFGLLNSIEVENERLVHQVLGDMRALKTTNKGGRALPRSDEEARNNAFLSFRSYGLRPGQKLEVYTGPGYNYHRAANGKAAVSTNATLKLAGAESGWAMVEYEVSRGVNRIGYIDISQLKERLDLQVLAFYYDTATILQNCALTDDPDGQAKTLVTLAAGTEVYMLAPYVGVTGDWAYVQAQSDVGLVRGFVPASYVTGEYDESMDSEIAEG